MRAVLLTMGSEDILSDVKPWLSCIGGPLATVSLQHKASSQAQCHDLHRCGPAPLLQHGRAFQMRAGDF